MKITKAQSQENRARIVETASTLFRERGYDGVSVADLMVAAGLTHGGFYKHFGSKADLMAEATEHGLAAKRQEQEGGDARGFVERYVSRAHRDARSQGCTVAALCGEAARQSPAVQAKFEAGIASLLTALEQAVLETGEEPAAARAMAMGTLAQMVGAVVLSRACPDESPLVDEILSTNREQVLRALGEAPGGEPGASLQERQNNGIPAPNEASGEVKPL